MNQAFWMFGIVLSAELAIPAQAQIIPATNDTQTQVIQNNTQLEIRGGVTSQDNRNLFHSFEQFNLGTNQTATFYANPEIQNILGRVTGGQISTIDGLLRVVNSPAHLYLMNPAGIIFGENARLDVPGSFTATTATGIQLGDDWFRAIGSNDYLALAGNPTGFAFGAGQQGVLLNAGNLTVLEGETLRLVGGTVINTGTLAAPGGEITIAAIPEQHLVRISQAGSLLSLDLPLADQNQLAIPADAPTAQTLPELLTGGSINAATGVTIENGVVRLTESGTEVPNQAGVAIAAGQLNTTSTVAPDGDGDLYVLGDYVDADRAALESGTGTAQVGFNYLFIDSNVTDYQVLADGAVGGTDLTVIQGRESGVERVTERLSSVTNANSVQIAADGSAGNFWLGRDFVSRDTLGQYSSAIATWGNSLALNTDLLLLSCYLALGETGEQFVQAIQQLTGADVAASTNVTGSAAFGGDWTLEYSTGQIEAPIALSAEAMAAYSDKLAIFTVTNNTDCGVAGCGSFRQAINDANGLAGPDTIQFNIAPGGAQTITPGDLLPDITDTVAIDGTTQPGFVTTPLIELSGNNFGTPLPQGLVLAAGSDGSTIRGLVINGFAGSAIQINSANNIIVGNYIGTNLAGNAAVPNQIGIEIFSNNNTIGGLLPTDRNVISGNDFSGVTIVGAANNRVRGNYIGLSSNGNAVIPNATGVELLFGTANNLIGGSAPGSRNVISGNTDTGILLTGDNNRIQGNYIGTNAAGTAARGNGTGIFVESSNNLIGTDSNGIGDGAEGNLISGNLGYGIEITTPEGFVVNNVVAGNRIGTNATGLGPIGNGAGGILLDGFFGLSDNLIGGTAPNSGNTIAFNGGNGITIGTAPATRILGNSIFANAGLGIDIGDDGVSPNDPNEAAPVFDNPQNFPVLAIAEPANASTQTAVIGSFNSFPNQTFRLEFFRNAAADGSGFGEGQTFLGAINVTTDNNGNATFPLTNPAIVGAASLGSFITATATSLSTNNTSEFSQARIVDQPTVSIADASVLEGNSGTTPLIFSLNLSRPSSQPVQVSVISTNGSATAPGDFIAFNQPINFAPGTTDATFATFSVNGDRILEANEQFFVNLAQPLNAGLLDSQAIATILNDDSLSLQINDVSSLEGTGGSSTLSFLITLSNPSEIPISVDFMTQNGTALSGLDYSANSGTLTLPNDGVTTTQTLTVPVNPDNINEFDETFTVSLSSASTSPVSIATVQATGTIINDDTPSLVINDVTVPVPLDLTSPLLATFTVRLSNPTDIPVSVEYNTVDGSAIAGSDYESQTGVLQFDHNQLSQTIQVPITAQPFANLKDFSVVLRNPVNAALEQPQGIGTLLGQLAEPGPCPPNCGEPREPRRPGAGGILNRLFREPPRLPRLSLNEAVTTLQNIESNTGATPALFYVNFIPSVIKNPTDLTELEANATDAFEEYFGRSTPTQTALKPLEQDTDQLELLLVLPDGRTIRHRLADVTRSQVMESVRALQEAVADPRQVNTTSYQAPAEQLYAWLIAPVRADLDAADIDNLSFIMPSGLRSLPVATLYDGQQFLVEQYSLGMMPSLNLVDTRHTPITSAQVLAMGASEFDNLSPLPAVPIEIDLITEEIWSGESIFGDAFTPEALKAERRLRPFSIVHLATHGEFRPGRPENSYIQFANRRVGLDDIRSLGLNDPPVELLVLSACRTALGDEEAELGFAGLSVQAGVKSALASFWNISDEATLGFMSTFYEQLQSSNIKAEALRQAQIALLQGQIRFEDGVLRSPYGEVAIPPDLNQLGDYDLSHPYYWSGFTLVGSPW